MTRRSSHVVIKVTACFVIVSFCLYQLHNILQHPRMVFIGEVETQQQHLSDQETHLLDQLRLQMEKNRQAQQESEKKQQKLQEKINKQEKTIQQQQKLIQKHKQSPQSDNVVHQKQPSSKYSNSVEFKQVEVQGHKVNLHPSVNVVPSVPPKNSTVNTDLCLPLPQSLRPVRICIHDPKLDTFMSATIKNQKLWKQELVLQMDRVLQLNSEMGLVDIGANIGVYTLTAASLGRDVLAVDMLDTNILLLQNSLQLGNFSSLVTLVKNAVYKDHNLELSYENIQNNVGRASIVEAPKQKNGVQSVCLDDLIPLVRSKVVYLKLAIENSEHLALACAHDFFNKVNVQIVQMEWIKKSEEATSEIKYFMRRHNYLAKTLVGTEYKLWEVKFSNFVGDVFFLKGGS